MRTFFTEYDFCDLPTEMAKLASQTANEMLIKASTRVYLVSDTLESSTYVSTTKGSDYPFVGYIYDVRDRKKLTR